MHLTQEQSVAAFQHVEKSFKMARKRFGDHIANLSITPADGTCSLADRYGHFDLHPYAAASLTVRITDVNPIP